MWRRGSLSLYMNYTPLAIALWGRYLQSLSGWKTLKFVSLVTCETKGRKQAQPFIKMYGKVREWGVRMCWPFFFFFLLKIKTVVVISFKWNNSHKLVQISVRETNQRDHSITFLVPWSTSYSVPVLMAAAEFRANTFVKAWFPKKQQQPQRALWLCFC